MKNQTAFIGLSHLGLVTSLSWASLFPPVIGIDLDPKIIKPLQRGKVYLTEDGLALQEPGMDQLFKKVHKNYFPTTDFSKLKDCKFIFFAKDTPKNINNPEQEIFKLIKKAIPFFQDHTTIVIMSQVPIGFCRMVENYIRKARPEINFELYHWVDTIVMTNAIDRFLHPERIIIGTSDANKPINKLLSRYLDHFSCPIFKISFESAEVTKAAINFYLATSVTYANTLADICELSGADINEVIPSLRSDKRIGQFAYIKPNLKIAGGHLERDLLMLSKVKKQNSLLDFIIKHNQTRYQWVIKQLQPLLQSGKKTRIAIWGLSYKKDSSSTKNAASLDIIRDLSEKADLVGYDPLAILPKEVKIKTVKDKYQALKGADCLFILTDWDEFKNIDLEKLQEMRNKLIIDVPAILYPQKGHLANYKYITMGLAN